MNLKVVFKVLGTVLFWESVLMIPSLFFSIIDNSYDRDAFIVSIILLGFIGLMLKSIRVTGACSSSTTGGLKMIRVIILIKSIIREVRHTIHPSSVSKIKIGGKSVEDDVVDNTLIFFFTYILVLFVSAMIISLDNFDFMTTFSAALASVSNTGSGFGLIGPLGSFSQFSNLSKLTMTISMIIGRLEVLPVITLISPSIWHKQ